MELLISRYCCIYLVVYIIYISLYFFRFPKQSQFNPYPEKHVEYGNLLVMPANGRRDLIRCLKVNQVLVLFFKVFFIYYPLIYA